METSLSLNVNFYSEISFEKFVSFQLAGKMSIQFKT